MFCGSFASVIPCRNLVTLQRKDIKLINALSLSEKKKKATHSLLSKLGMMAHACVVPATWEAEPG